MSYGREMTVESLRLKKPDAHYLERALENPTAPPESVLYVGDNESDIVAAERASLESAFVRRSHRHDAHLEITPTDEVEGLYGLNRLIHR
ncbi:HAD-IA family hydrolase [Natronococcus sp. A-GB7]|uniref:HAD-IA family hydrolase n=1 Tax=Natronococcus sp. A-GB7 TaxID=3037649 RepID=UPI0031BB2444